MSITYVSSEKVKMAAQYTDQALFRVSGDCLEDMQMMDGTMVAVGFARRPASPRFKGGRADGLCTAV